MKLSYFKIKISHQFLLKIYYKSFDIFKIADNKSYLMKVDLYIKTNLWVPSNYFNVSPYNYKICLLKDTISSTICNMAIPCLSCLSWH